MHFSNSREEQYIFDPTPCYDYEFRGSSEYKVADVFTENHYKALVFYKENESKQVDFKISHFSQTSKGLIYQLAKDFSTATSDLLVQLNSDGQVTKICNLEEIQNKYKKYQLELLEKYAHIPDMETILKNYETNLKNEEKLRKSLFYYGFYRIFFTGIKELILATHPKRQTTRIRKFDSYILSADLPVIETVNIEQVRGTYKVELKGKIDLRNFNKQQFMHACRLMYGKDISFSDIVFETIESYELDHKLNYQKASYSHKFEIIGKQVKKDYLEYKLKKHSFV